MKQLEIEKDLEKCYVCLGVGFGGEDFRGLRLYSDMCLIFKKSIKKQYDFIC